MKTFQASLDRIAATGAVLAVATAPTQWSIPLPGNIHLSPADLIIAVAFAAWLLGRCAERTWTWPRRPSFLTVLFVLLALLSGLRAPHRLEAVKEIVQYTEYFLILPLLIVFALRRPGTRRGFLLAIGGIGAVVIFLGTWQYWNPAVPAFKVRATFGNCHVLGGYLSLLLPMLHGVLIGGAAESRRLRIALILVLVAGLLTVLSGGSGVALLLALAMVSALRGRRALVAVLAGLLVVGLVAAYLPRRNVDHMRHTLATYDAQGQGTRRYMEWEAGVAMVRAYPLLGVGTGNYQAHIGQFYGAIPVPAIAAEPDSQMLYLVLAGSMGVPAMLCFVGMMLEAAAGALRRSVLATDGESRGVALGVLGGLIGFAVNSVWSPLLVRGIGPLLAWFLTVGVGVEEEADCSSESYAASENRGAGTPMP